MIYGPVGESLQPLVSTIPLIGRSTELSTLAAMLGQVDIRLVTLTGPGGIGKSRLALRLIDTVADAFPDGVAFVDLASIQEPSLVLPTIGQAYGVRDSGEIPVMDGLIRTIGIQRRLLALDSFEHVIAAAPAISDLLAACPNLTVLVTSRESLKLSGEYEFPVTPLSLPSTSWPSTADDVAKSPAVELFVQRARSVRPDFSLTEANAGAVGLICARLDGLPLAIELAAARSKVLSPPALLQRLTHRFTLLTGGPRDAPNRLRTMRDAISWSYDLLPAEDQMLFRRLSIFAGSFTESAASAVAVLADPRPQPMGDSIFEGISSLVDKSLIQQREGVDGEPRYSMMETVREFGLVELNRENETAAVRAAVTRWALALGDDIEQHIHGPIAAAWMNRIQVEQDNFRLVLGWLTAEDSEDPEDALRLVAALWPYWFDRGSLTEGRRWVTAALSRASTAEPSLLMPALVAAGLLAMAQGDFATATTYLVSGHSMAVELGQARSIAFARFGQGVIAQDQGNAAAARDHFLAALEAAREADDDRLIATALNNLGLVTSRLGDHASGRAHVEDALQRHRSANYGLGEALSLRFLGQITQAQGDARQAAINYRASLRFDPSELQSWHIAGSLEGLAASIGPHGEPELAARLFGAAEAIRLETGVSLEPALEAVHARAVAAIRAIVGDDAFTREFATGRAMSRNEAIAAATKSDAGPVTPTAPSTEPHRSPMLPATGDILTVREMEILRLLADGLSTREIADRLFISHRTVSTHTTNLLGKLHVDTRAAAIAYAHRSGMIATTRGDSSARTM